VHSFAVWPICPHLKHLKFADVEGVSMRPESFLRRPGALVAGKDCRAAELVLGPGGTEEAGGSRDVAGP
jgi:hypothetical protein